MRQQLLVASITSLVSLGAGVATAADGVINDVRLGVAIGVAETTEVDLKDAGASGEADDATTRISIGWVHGLKPLESWGGFIIGANLIYSQGGDDLDGDLDGVELETTSLGLDIEGGYAVAVPALKGLHLEAALFLGYLLQDSDLNVPGGTIDVGGDGFEYGLRASALYTFANSWQAGLDLRYLIERSTTGQEDALAGDIETSTDGLSVGLSVGYRF